MAEKQYYFTMGYEFGTYDNATGERTQKNEGKLDYVSLPQSDVMLIQDHAVKPALHVLIDRLYELGMQAADISGIDEKPKK